MQHSLSMRRKAVEVRETLGSSSLDWLRAYSPELLLPIEQCARAPGVKPPSDGVRA